MLPLNNQPGRFARPPLPPRALRALPRHRPAPRGDRAEPAQPRVRDRRRARRARPTGAVDGVIVAHGSHSGGYALYLKGRRLHYAYNFVGTEITTVSAERRAARRRGRGAGSCSRRRRPARGDVALSTATCPSARRRSPAPRRSPTARRASPSASSPSTPICDAVDGRGEVPAGLLEKVVVTVAGRSRRDGAARNRADLAMQ